MKFRVEVICVNDDGAEQRHDVMEMERQELAMETLGLTLAEGKAILRGVPRLRGLPTNQRGSQAPPPLSELR